MAYARFSHCDVYVFANSSGLECSGCILGGPTQFESTPLMIEHLRAHRDAGHDVPDGIENELWEDDVQNFRIRPIPAAVRSDTSLSADAAMDVFAKLIPTGSKVAYLSVPITSGQLMYQTLTDRAHSPGVTSLRSEIMKTNIAQARAHARSVEPWTSMHGYTILNPAETFVKAWGDAEYDLLWARFMHTYRPLVVLTTGWAFSRGARTEVLTARALELRFADLSGTILSMGQVREQWEGADATIRQRGWEACLPTGGMPAWDASTPQSH